MLGLGYSIDYDRLKALRNIAILANAYKLKKYIGIVNILRSKILYFLVLIKAL